MSEALALILAAIAGGAVVALVLIVRQHRQASEAGQQANERQMRLTADAARLEAELGAARRSADEQRALLAQTQTQLRDSFASLSKDALKENRSDFLQHAGDLLGPVRETLGRVQAQLVDVDRAREGSFRAVAAQIGSLLQTQEQLRQAADGLSRSLRSPNVRGKWGEVQLRRIIELAGMLEQCDFVEKATLTTEDGSRQTPDLIVRLPGDTNIIIDSKVPIDAYLAATQATSDGERDARLAAHARQVRDHIRTLAAKDYARRFQPSPEFVVMFLPLEPLLSAAFEQDGGLLEYAASVRVIPATPMTLLALLKAVAYGWKHQLIARNTEEIQAIGRDLYDRLAMLVEHLEGIGRNIKQAADNYDRFVGSLENKVLPGARRFKDLGVSSTKEIDLLEPLHLALRPITKDELTEV